MKTKPSRKTRVGIFFGGISPEHEVSLISARGIISNIDKEKFKAVKILIDKHGDFWTGKNAQEKIDLNSLSKKIDVAFPILHGEGGEDGALQGFFKVLKIPFVGADILASAVCLDKAVLNKLTQACGILNPRFETVDYDRDSAKEIKSKITDIKKTFKLPLFIKPARTGSSVGISKMKNWKELEGALDMAKQFDRKIVVEEGVENCKEIEVSVLGDQADSFKVAFPGRVVPGEDFYDYDDKYKNNKAKFEIPAKLSKEMEKKVKQVALEAYRIANCQGLSRVDLFLDDKNKIYLNEINTMPGFTPFSMYPKMWEASGLSYRDLITKLIELALAR